MIPIANKRSARMSRLSEKIEPKKVFVYRGRLMKGSPRFHEYASARLLYRTKRIAFLLLSAGLILASDGAYVTPAHADELTGYISAEGRLFFHEPLSPDQERNNVSLAIQTEYFHKAASGSFTLVPFARLDSEDPERSHFDVREFSYLFVDDPWQLLVGASKVFWGVTEFVHLVDIINQTDAVESLDGEDKLGQPMIHFSISREWGLVDLFALPYFRERTFPGRNGRLRAEQVVDAKNAQYESSAEEHHLDLAVRYSKKIHDLDFGVYHFKGTGREPTFQPVSTAEGNVVLIPLYEQINQSGVDLQMTSGQWMFKLENIYRTGQGSNFFAVTGGFEYTFVNIADRQMDLGIVGEWAYDSRRDKATTPYEKDFIVGLRLAVNDQADTIILAGVTQDLEDASRIVTIEGSRRLGKNIKAILETGFFFQQEPQDFAYSLRNDDFVRLQFAHYF